MYMKLKYFNYIFYRYHYFTYDLLIYYFTFLGLQI